MKCPGNNEIRLSDATVKHLMEAYLVERFSNGVRVTSIEGRIYGAALTICFTTDEPKPESEGGEA